MDIHGISARYPPNIHRISSGLWPMSVEIRFEANERRDPVDIWRISTVGIYEYPAQGFGSGSSRIWCFCLDPNSVFKFLWIRMRLQPRIPEHKKSAERALKAIPLKKTLKLWLRNVKKWKRQQFLDKNHHKIDGKFSRQRCLDPDADPDLVLKNHGSGSGLSWEVGSSLS